MPSMKNRAISMAEPLALISMSLFYLSLTLMTNPLLLIHSPTAFRAKWFQAFFSTIGPQMATSPIQKPYVAALLSRAHGTVLDLGPGAGDQMYQFKSDQITRIYGVEPNVFFHDALRKQAAENGLEGKYFPLEAGAQPGSLLPALEKAGVLPKNYPSIPAEGVFDSIVAVKALCSVPRAELKDTVRVLQSLLKPGGEFLFFEHLGNQEDSLARWYSWVLNFVWPAVLGGCQLDGDLDRLASGMEGWECEVRDIDEFEGYEVFRYVRGICRKDQS